MGFGKTAQEKALTAYKEDQFPEAKAFYQRVDPKELGAEDLARLQEVDAAIGSMIGYFVAQASAAVANRQEQRNNYPKAIRDLEAALRLMPPDHPSRKATEQQLGEIKARRAAFEREYVDLKGKMKLWLGSWSQDESHLRELNGAFERLRVLRIVLQMEDLSLYEMAIGEVRVSCRDGDFAKADKMAKVARAMASQEANPARPSQITPEDERLFAVINYHLARGIAAQQKEAEALVPKMQKALAEGRFGDARGVADEIGKLDPKNAQLARLLSELDRRQNPPKPKSGGARKASPAPDSSPNAEEASSFEEASSQEAEAQKSVDSLLDQFRKWFNSGNVFDAIVGIDKAIADLPGNKFVGKLAQQRDQWEPVRKKLVAEVLERADRLYVEQDPVALEAYQRLLRLNPPEEIRRHADSRISTLLQILKK
jgi:tetratricopeptide (TPR) repeat protein